MKVIKDHTASTQKAVTAIAANRDLSALIPLQAELMHEPIAQFSQFWQNVIVEMRDSESKSVSDFRHAAQQWQASVANSTDSFINHPWVAHGHRQWIDAASLTWKPLSDNARQMFNWPFQREFSAGGHAAETPAAQASAHHQA
ncbi:hypothetical protein [Dyella silvatica]|uniref:hypothetical protein n=1 Tax=Dyella silvatica TaxID=2992128 RepID=UPI0022533D0E|nr:hypothetical protein [Dyella silvatica]